MSNGNPTGRRKVRFEYAGEPGSAVFVAGSFNDWNPGRHALKDRESKGKYSTTIPLLPGRYEYKFVIDGIWCVDPKCGDWTPNDHGSLNSVVTVT